MSDLLSVVLSKMVNKESTELIKDYKMEELELPLMKYNKIYYIVKFKMLPRGV
jgi:hypothetical protein